MLLKGIDIVAIMAAARRHAKTTAISVGVCLTLALIFSLVSVVKFTAQTSILIGNKQIRALQDMSAQSNLAAENALVDNQIEVIKGERVMLAAIRGMKLKDDPEFNGTEPPSIVTIVTRFIMALNPMRLFQPAGESDPDYKMLRTVVRRLSDAVVVSRNGKSNVVQIAVTVKSPKKAARIANGYAAAYLNDQIAARVEAAKSAGEWFRARLDELREQSAKANRAVEEYRSRNNLVSANGQLMTDQQLTQLNNDLTQAAAEVVSKQAQYDNLKALVESGRIDAIVSEALNNSTVTQLRQSQAEATKRYNEIVSRVGPKHEQALRQKRQVEDNEKLIFQELRRFLSGFQSELAVARERREQLSRRLAESTVTANSANAALVQLRQLEQQASAVQSLYQSFLQRSQETMQQESYPMSDARVIADAAPPLEPSQPRVVLIAAAGVILGLGIGVGIGAYREVSDRAYRTADQVEEDLGVDVVGLLPLLDTVVKTNNNAGPGLRDYRPVQAVDLGKYAIQHPFSSYSETLRAMKIAMDMRLTVDGAKIVGVVSSMPREGKSTVSLNLAGLLALQGSRVALVDADLREAGLTSLAGLKPAVGLGEILLDQASLGDVLVSEPGSSLAIIPATVKHDLFLSGDLISSPTMAALLKNLSSYYEYVILDLPPVGPVVDGRAAAHLLDGLFMIVEWGAVPRRVVRSAIASSPAVHEKLIGAVMNNVEVDKLKTYEPYGLDSKQEEIFSRYYR
ncbi:AAA family ATPase [Methylosinus sp. PW1]|uniref:AAA family ATPase n=1 Tax=Methylosinus sp. PW1 TaxID=107636 RepID=UPI000A642B45|nr:AAA family ATPase [Methylosinus sp. PW1]